MTQLCECGGKFFEKINASRVEKVAGQILPVAENPLVIYRCIHCNKILDQTKEIDRQKSQVELRD